MKCSSLSLELLYLTTSSAICQELFSKFFDFRLSLWQPLVWQLFNFNTFKTVCQEVFFVLFQTFWTVFFNFRDAVSNFYMIPHRIVFVKNFFHFFSNSILCSAALADSLHILAHPKCFVKHEFSLSGNSFHRAFVSFQRVHRGIKRESRSSPFYYYIVSDQK